MKKIYGTVAVGMVAGVALTVVVGIMAMPKLMVVEHVSKYDTVAETCVALKDAIEAEGWHCPAIRDMNKAMAKSGVHVEKPYRIVELCKANYAKDVLETNPEVTTLMPCAWGVYAGEDGKIRISGMNMGLMGKMFGGNIARIMGGHVAKDEKRILATVVAL